MNLIQLQLLHRKGEIRLAKTKSRARGEPLYFHAQEHMRMPSFSTYKYLAVNTRSQHEK